MKFTEWLESLPEKEAKEVIKSKLSFARAAFEAGKKIGQSLLKEKCKHEK